jgi:hypothetical protein
MKMTSKISAVLAAALILGSASVALAANKPQTVRQQRQPSVMLLEDGAQVRRPAVNGYAVEENYIDKQNVWE